MNKVIIITGVLLTTSCGMFSKMTEAEQELNYKLDKLYLDYSYKRDSLIIEFYQAKPTKNCCEKKIDEVYKHEGLYISE